MTFFDSVILRVNQLPVKLGAKGFHGVLGVGPNKLFLYFFITKID